MCILSFVALHCGSSYVQFAMQTHEMIKASIVSIFFPPALPPVAPVQRVTEHRDTEPVHLPSFSPQTGPCCLELEVPSVARNRFHGACCPGSQKRVLIERKRESSLLSHREKKRVHSFHTDKTAARCKLPDFILNILKCKESIVLTRRHLSFLKQKRIYSMLSRNKFYL